MKVFVDTNILIDLVCRREPFAEDAKKLFAYGCVGILTLKTCALSVVNAMFVAHHYNHDEVRTNLRRMSTFVEILDLRGTFVVEMLSSDWKDYEDAVQNQTALMANCDCIVTRNKKDFRQSSLPVYTVSELFDIL